MLVTLAEVKAHLNIPVADTSQDAFLNNQIALVTTAVENYCNRSIVARTFEETFYGAYTGRVERPYQVTLYHFPIIQLIEVRNERDDHVVINPLADYLVHKPTGKINKKSLCGVNVTPYYDQNIVYKYRAGYETIPADIKFVAFSLIGEAYNKKKNGVDMAFGSDVQSISIPGVISIAYDYSLEDNQANQSYGVILGKYRNVLNYYRSDRAIYKGSGELRYIDTIN